MMKVLTFVCMLAVTPVLAAAQSVQDQVLTQLAEQGFHDFEVSTTLLGRIRVTSKSDTLKRELVFNPATGEILRDYWTPLPSSSSRSPRIILTDPSDKSGTTSTNTLDTDRDDDNKDDHDNVDERDDSRDERDDDNNDDDDKDDDDRDDDDKDDDKD